MKCSSKVGTGRKRKKKAALPGQAIRGRGDMAACSNKVSPSGLQVNCKGGMKVTKIATEFYSASKKTRSRASVTDERVVWDASLRGTRAGF
jgi:hypothetical protein